MSTSASSGRGLSAGAFIAVGGVALALMIMELTIAVVTGFKNQITEKVTGFDSQISIGAPYDYSSGAIVDYIHFSPALAETIKDFAPGHTPSLAMQMPAMIKTDDDFAGMVYVAHDDNYDFSFERGNIVEGSFPDFSAADSRNSIVISRRTADMLGLEVGSKVYSCFFIEGKLKTRRHNVAAIYESNLGEYDKSIVYASLAALQHIAGVDSLSGTRIDYNGFAVDRIDELAGRLQSRLTQAAHSAELNELYPVTTVLQYGAVYFSWLSLLDTNVVVIFILMLCVAGFTLVSSLYMIVLDRVRSIGILRAVGASRRLVSRVFLNMGMRLALVGVAVGNLFGIGLALLQSADKFVRLDPDMYYLRYVPVEIDPLAFVCLNVGVLVVAWLVLFIPARSAAKIDPTEIMRAD